MDARLPDIDERYGAAALVGDAQRPAVVEKRRRHGTTQAGRRLRIGLRALRRVWNTRSASALRVAERLGHSARRHNRIADSNNDADSHTPAENCSPVPKNASDKRNIH
jgi:hypothetical protein